MNHRAFRHATERLRGAGVALEDWLNVDRRTITQWESGTKSIPAIRMRQIEWLLRTEENKEARRAAGLADCVWVERETARLGTHPSLEEAESLLPRLEVHYSECETCAANEAWSKQHLRDPGPYPMPGLWGLVSGVLGRVPRPLFPAALGAALLGGIVTLRVAVAAVIGIVGGGVSEVGILLGEGLLAVVAAALAGGAGGLVIPIVRPLLRRFGALGDYLTGIAVMWAYLFSLVIAAPIAFGEPILENGSTPAVVIVGAILGAFAAFVWRR